MFSWWNDSLTLQFTGNYFKGLQSFFFLIVLLQSSVSAGHHHHVVKWFTNIAIHWQLFQWLVVLLLPDHVPWCDTVILWLCISVVVKSKTDSQFWICECNIIFKQHYNLRTGFCVIIHSNYYDRCLKMISHIYIIRQVERIILVIVCQEGCSRVYLMSYFSLIHQHYKRNTIILHCEKNQSWSSLRALWAANLLWEFRESDVSETWWGKTWLKKWNQFWNEEWCCDTYLFHHFKRLSFRSFANESKYNVSSK